LQRQGLFKFRCTPGIVGSTGEIGSNLLTASRGIAPGAASATANAAGNAYNLADTAVNTSGLASGNVNPALTNLANTANTSALQHLLVQVLQVLIRVS
jgi:hypothetical protein